MTVEEAEEDEDKGEEEEEEAYSACGKGTCVCMTFLCEWEINTTALSIMQEH